MNKETMNDETMTIKDEDADETIDKTPRMRYNNGTTIRQYDNETMTTDEDTIHDDERRRRDVDDDDENQTNNDTTTTKH